VHRFFFNFRAHSEYRLHTGGLIYFPAVSMRSDFDDCHGLCVFSQATVYVHLIVIGSYKGESLSRAPRLMPKRHNAKLCPFAIRQRIVTALANGDSKRAIARGLRVSNNTVTAVAEQEWQQVEARKAILAAQAERNAFLAGEQMTEALEQRQVPIGSLVPVYGVSLDKALALRGDPALTIHHTHTHTHQHELLINALRDVAAKAEQRAQAAVVEVPALPAAGQTPSANHEKSQSA
jgi:hypothetical protein